MASGSPETIHARDQDVFQTAVLQLGQDRQPELCPFGLGQPQAQQLLVTLHIDAQCQIERLVDHPLVRADLQYNAVQINDGIERIQRPVLPFVDLLDDTFGHLRYQPAEMSASYISLNASTISRVLKPLA